VIHLEHADAEGWVKDQLNRPYPLAPSTNQWRQPDDLQWQLELMAEARRHKVHAEAKAER
jgi:hypothetical protein